MSHLACAFFLVFQLVSVVKSFFSLIVGCVMLFAFATGVVVLVAILLCIQYILDPGLLVPKKVRGFQSSRVPSKGRYLFLVHSRD